MNQDELSELASVLAAAVQQGRCHAVSIEGATGSGRTHAITWLAAELRVLGFDTRELCGVRGERLVSLAAISALIPDRGFAGPAEARQQLIGALRDTDRPVAICVDDADFLDEASIAVLGFAARRVPAALVATTRPGRDIGDVVGGTTLVRLAPLDDAGMSEIIDSLASSPPTAEVRARLLRLCEGNPGAAAGLAGSLTPDQLAGVAALDPLQPSPDLYRRFLGPLLSGAEQKVMALLLACEPGASIALVHRAAALLGADPSIVDVLQGDGRVRDHGGRLYLVPRAVEPALYSMALTSERIAAHRALAEASKASSHRGIWHAAQAATEPDEALALELAQSSEPAFRRGGAAAVSEIFERAATLSPEPARRGQRLAAAAEWAWLAGNPERGRALLFVAQEQSRELELRTEVAYLRGSIELASGSVDYAMTVLRDAAAERLESSMPRQAATPLLIRAMDAALAAGDVAQATALGQMAGSLREETDLLCTYRVACVIGTARVLTGDLTGLDIIRPMTIETPTDAEQPLALVAMRTALIGGDIRRLAALSSAAADRVRESDSIGQLPFVSARQALAELLLGRLDNAVAIATEGVSRSGELGQRNSEAEHLAILALAQARRGQADHATDLAERSFRLSDARGLAWPAALSTWALGEVELSLGAGDKALTRLSTLWLGSPRERHPVIAILAAPELVEAAVRSGATERADTVLASLDRWTRAASHTWAEALLERCRGLRARDLGVAREAFERALALHTTAARPFDVARTQLAYGERLRRDRHRAECRPHLRAALERFENVGAEIWRDRARAELRASGETLRRHEDETAIESLTPQERTVAQLVAEGRTNRDVAEQLFLSVRTVEFHLRNIFAKLDITSRVELMGFDEAFVVDQTSRSERL